MMLNELFTDATPGRLFTASLRVRASTPSTSAVMRSATVSADTPGSGSASTIEGSTAIASGFLTRDASSKVAYETKIPGWTLNRMFSASPTISMG